MPTSTKDTLRLTVAALLRATNENQTDLGRGLRLTQGQVSRKQSGTAAWTLDDVDRLSAHYGIPVPDLLAGPSRACELLSPRRRASLVGGRQSTIAV